MWMVGLGSGWMDGGSALTDQKVPVKSELWLLWSLWVPTDYWGLGQGGLQNEHGKKWDHGYIAPVKAISFVQIWLPILSSWWVIERILPAWFFPACHREKWSWVLAMDGLLTTLFSEKVTRWRLAHDQVSDATLKRGAKEGWRSIITAWSRACFHAYTGDISCLRQSVFLVLAPTTKERKQKMGPNMSVSGKRLGGWDTSGPCA